MSHPLIVALYASAADASQAASALHALGVTSQDISVVARDHQEEGVLADTMGATPGADIEDSRPAGRLGELSGQILAAIAVGMPGIGPIVAAGPLGAELGEAAGHAAGSIDGVLQSAGLPADTAQYLREEVERGAILLGVHATHLAVDDIRAALRSAGGRHVATTSWPEPTQRA